MTAARSTSSTSVARAMAAQLDRVNSDPANLRAALEAARAENARLLDQLHALRGRIAALEDSGSSIPDDPAGQMYNGRPYITAQQAADRVRLSLATVNRYCNTGFWSSSRIDGYHWVVFTDVPLTPKPRR